ncbi:MAG: hypothetical protein WBB01_00525 [Phormidesmis sp.]
MTYTTTQNAPAEIPASADPSTVEKLKTLQQESTQRSKRVFKILRTAYAEMSAELKDGRTVISPLAKEVTAETVATVKQKSQQAADTVNQTWNQETDSKDLSERLIRLARVVAIAAKQNLFPQIKKQAIKLDELLVRRYGSRYTDLKDQVTGRTQRAEQRASEATAETNSQPVVIEVESEIV